jgi:hypothetical protein
VLLLETIDMRALHASLAVEAAQHPEEMGKCSLKQLEAILRQQAICFQAGSADGSRGRRR